MDRVRRAFWTSLVVYLLGVTFFPYGHLRTFLDLIGAFAILLGLVLLGRWTWSRFR